MQATPASSFTITHPPLSQNPPSSSSSSDSYLSTRSLLSRKDHSNGNSRMGPSTTHELSPASPPPYTDHTKVSRRRPARSSPLSFTTSPTTAHARTLSNPSEEGVGEEVEDWDNTPTSRWGYVLLITTWLVFVIGMGSCLDVWSWAWDVGETPYAPPELEDDPTLPIVGYYPALLVLTAVMAWVWVGFAWVGMKYFKHAKITGE